MRTPALAALALVLALAPGAPAPARGQAPAAPRDSIDLRLDSLARDPSGLTVDRRDVRSGSQTVAAGETVRGTIAAWNGDLDVRGTVTGNAVAIGGDVVLHPGAVVHGDAVAVGGEVRNDGGTVDGEMRALSALTVGPLQSAPQRTPMEATRRAAGLAVGWYLVLAAIGVVVALFARRNLETIAERIRDDFSRSFLYGVLGQVALLPALVLGIIALAITVLGILLIPFAVVGFVLATAGALALGFLTMSFVTGDAVMRWRGAALPYGPPPVVRYLLVGLSLYFLLWLLGAALTWAGVLGGLVRFLVATVTWAALTVGFGATLASRGGTRSPPTPPAPVPPPAEDYAWQTPTPVSGVAAARRPTPAPRSREP